MVFSNNEMAKMFTFSWLKRRFFFQNLLMTPNETVYVIICSMTVINLLFNLFSSFNIIYLFIFCSWI